MDHDDSGVHADPAQENARALSEREISILRQRSEAYRQNPGAALPFDEALDQIERMLTEPNKESHDETAPPPEDLSMRAESSRRPRRERRYLLEELLAQVTEENRHELVDWGPPVGREFTGDEWEECQPAAPVPPSTPR